MALKHRVKKIERAIVPKQIAKLWIIRDCYTPSRIDPKGKKRVAAKIEAIKQGGIKHKDGTYYQEGDTFMIVSRIFTTKKEGLPPLDMSDNEDFQKSMKAYKEEANKELQIIEEEKSTEQRIEALKKRKEELKAKIKEKEK